MAGEVEVERLVARLVGDGEDYQMMMREAQQSLMEYETEVERSTEVDRERQKAMDEGARLTRQMETATEAYTRQMEELDEMYHKGTINLETLTRAMEKHDEALVQSHGYSQENTQATQESNDALGGTSGVVQTASGDLGMFMNINRGAGRSVRNLGSAVAGLGVVLDVVSPGLGATAVHIGMVASAGGQAITSMYYLKTSIKSLVSLALNPYTLAIAALVGGGMVVWKMYTKMQEEENKRLEESLRKLEEAVKSYGRVLDLLGKVPGVTTTNEQIVENAKTAESAYEAAFNTEREAIKRRRLLADEVEKERSAQELFQNKIRESAVLVPSPRNIIGVWKNIMPSQSFDPSKGLKAKIAEAVELSRAAAVARADAEKLMEATRKKVPAAKAAIEAEKAAEKEKDAADQRRKTLKDMIADLVKEQRTRGMSVGQIKAFEASLLGAKPAMREWIGRVTDEVDAQKKAQQARESANKSLQQLMENLRWQAVALREGLTPSELAVRKLEEQMGVTLGAARAAAREVEQLEKEKKAKEDAEKATEKLMKTQEKMNAASDYAIAGSAQALLFLDRQRDALGGVTNAVERGQFRDRLGITRSRGPTSVPAVVNREWSDAAATPSAVEKKSENHLKDLLALAREYWKGSAIEVKPSGLN